ncbi:erythromycin esterase [Fusarium sp. NRRL 52700]|nr:erythromycin esterase [Fusarium sp. NRRL 52700]
MNRGRDETWNLQDTHMFETLTRLLKHRGRDSNANVWAHNSYVGDAQATSMGWSREELNIGQLCKERYEAQVLSIGTGTNTGTVATAQNWDGSMNIMELQPELPGSYEELVHAAGIDNFALDLHKGKCDDKLRETLNEKRLERFIGVLYRPETEQASHYSYAVLLEQFDGFIWFDKSEHVETLEVHQPKSPWEYHEIWPFGL